MGRRLGVLTIGQAPRHDWQDMYRQLGPGVEVLEAGALDGLTREAIEGLQAGPGEEALATRLGDGTPVVVSKERLVPLVVRALASLEARGVEATLLGCTGSFPSLPHRRPLLLAGHLLHHGVAALAQGARLAVLCPLCAQEESTRERWREVAAEVGVFVADPYGPPQRLDAAAEDARSWGAEMVLLDCMGYTEAMKARVAERSGTPVLLARSLVARLVGELLA